MNLVTLILCSTVVCLASLIDLIEAHTLSHLVEKKPWYPYKPRQNAKFNQVNPLVVNGQLAGANAVPSMVTLQEVDEAGYAYHICGGSLAAPNKVVTAAHCLEGMENKVLVVGLGFNKLSEGDDVPNAQMIEVKSFFNHPKTSLPHDIAVITLKENARLVPGYVELMDYTTKLPGALVNAQSFLVGWGRLGGDKEGSNDLMKANFRVLSAAECGEYWGNQFNPKVHVCAMGLQNSGGCMGDSGGPLIVWAGGKQVQIGVVSWGPDNCDVTYPSMYISVGYYRSWIEKHIKS